MHLKLRLDQIRPDLSDINEYIADMQNRYARLAAEREEDTSNKL